MSFDLLRILSVLTGLMIVGLTLLSAIRTFVLPRAAPDPIVRFVFVSIMHFYVDTNRLIKNYSTRDNWMAFYAPFSLFALLTFWLGLVFFGFCLMYWGITLMPADEIIHISGSSLFTLGFASPKGIPSNFLVFMEAGIGLLLGALLIAYLPTIYAAFSRRETLVTLLEVRAGSPPSAVEMILRFNRINGLGSLDEQWQTWENWFSEIEESHTSLPALIFFRSPRPDRSWITAACTVLDAASLTLSTLDHPTDSKAALCIRAGYLALRHISDYLQIPYPENPKFGDPISVTRQDYDAVFSTLEQAGVKLKADREKAWQDFAGWRVNYDAQVQGIVRLIMAPDAPWTGDRKVPMSQPKIFK
jgi:hypothetical protein